MSKTKKSLKRSSESEINASLKAFRFDSTSVDQTILTFFESLDCPRALTCYLLFSYGEHEQLARLDCNPSAYESCELFRDSFAATSFLSKYKGLKTGIDTKAIALSTFDRFEEQCRNTNLRFKNLSLDPSYNGPNASLLFAMTRKIERILGSFSPDEVVDSANWGPGATTAMTSREASGTNKFHVEREITYQAKQFIEPWFEAAYPSWGAHIRNCGGFIVQTGNKLTTVPKNSKTDRVIAIEPGINLWFQKAIGTMIRKRLYRNAGIDLNSQEVNQEFALLGSLDPSIATIDFSSASDSISKSLVAELLPDTWYNLLSCFRSSTTNDKHHPHRWEKFSSMGNGYTFELESLIFYSAASAVVEFLSLDPACISVFGDDVIIPTDAVMLFTSFCKFLGFTVNESKSFSTTHFRESCGSYFWSGVDCKPIYLKKVPKYAHDLYKLANAIRLLSHRYCFNNGCDIRFKRVWLDLFSLHKKSYRLLVSDGYGDIGFIDNFDIASPSIRKASRGFEGYLSLSYISVPIVRVHEGTGLLLDRLKNRSVDRDSGNEVPTKSSVVNRVKPVLIHDWYSLGSWM